MDTAHPINAEPHASESFETVYLDPKTIHFRHDDHNLTYTTSDGKFYPRISLRRSFPLSAENTYVVVRVSDEKEDRSLELGVIRDCKDLDEESRQAVEGELRRFYLVPVIQRIHSIREEFGFLYWSVETDRGPKDFIMRDSIIGHVRQVGPGRWLIIDINQTRYEVRDYEKLDEKSQELLNKFLLL